MFPGCLTALVTPFRDGAVDTKALADLVEEQIAAGVNGLVPCGSTGESATMSHEEHLTVVREVVRVARKRVPVVAGTGSNATAEAIRLTRGAEELGADAALLISPYYNRPTQDGIVRHYAAIADATRLPLIVYNIQARTASNITAETMAQLAAIPRVVGVKEASGSIPQVLEILDLCGPAFAVWSGDDVITLPLMASGAAGVISVVANVAPKRMVELTDALRASDLARARRAHASLMPLFRALTLEVNPIPVKTALAMMGRCADEFRLPLTPLTAKNRAILEMTLREQGLV
ncbi:MAG: 4-hydroxy-tetrahydrodipicolinate synthase [Candidatus Binatia bacterium]